MIQDRRILKIDIALKDAKRFIECASAWKKRLNSERHVHNTKEGGSAKRASLDLSRSLSEMRKP